VIRRALAVVLVALGLFASTVGPVSTADAARQPTFREREALTAALPSYVRRIPVGCVFLHMRVSRNGRYAEVNPAFLSATRDPCLRYAFDGFWILRRSARWKIIYGGSDPPPCSLRVPRDLITCLR
jgi:hypothetical protein